MTKILGSITKVRDELNEVFDLDQVQTYLTGSDLVSEDFVQSTEKGIQKTEIIAIIFIILVLIVVFRSPIVPFDPYLLSDFHISFH